MFQIPHDDANPNSTNSETSTAPVKAARNGSTPPQLITLLTKQPISGSLSTDIGHLTPSGGDVKQTQAPSGGENAQVLRVDSGATRIILPEGVNVGQEILVYVEKSPAENNTQQVKPEPVSSNTKVPEVDRKVPELDNMVAEAHRKIPEVDSMVAEVDRKIPEVDRMAPEVDRKVTKVDRMIPEVNTSVP